MKDEKGFTLIEVAVAAIIMTVGLVFLASLFTLAIAQNKFNKQFTSTTKLAQQKIEELMAVEKDDLSNRLNVGGDLTEETKKTGYYQDLDGNGNVTTNGALKVYRRYWKIENDPVLTGNQARIISVRVVAMQASRGRSAEETTLTTVRSW